MLRNKMWHDSIKSGKKRNNLSLTDNENTGNDNI